MSSSVIHRGESTIYLKHEKMMIADEHLGNEELCFDAYNAPFISLLTIWCKHNVLLNFSLQEAQKSVTYPMDARRMSIKRSPVFLNLEDRGLIIFDPSHWSCSLFSMHFVINMNEEINIHVETR